MQKYQNKVCFEIVKEAGAGEQVFS